MTPELEERRAVASGPRRQSTRPSVRRLDRPPLRRPRVVAIQLAILVVAMLLWEYLPKVGPIHRHFTFMDPFFISSPSLACKSLYGLATGTAGYPLLWPYARSTIEAAVIGAVVGTLLGAAVGLFLSNSPRVSQVLRPFIVALNAVPRIAIIPIVVVLFGPTLQASVITSITVVFFVVFFNAYEGGQSVPTHMLQNAALLNASQFQLMWDVRRPYVLAWTMAAVPNAVSFGLVSVVTAEVLTGTPGIGRLLYDSVTTVLVSETFALVIVLGVFGVTLLVLANLLRSRALHWWAKD
jgi:NitT/TauT family transport system permease protein